MITAPPWAELVLCREIFGVLQHLASRPLSKGHDGPVREAGRRLLRAHERLSELPREVLSDAHLALLGTLVGQLDVVPPEVVARTLVAPLGARLAEHGAGRPEWPTCYVEPPAGAHLQRLVVSVGPTIGLGDEFLSARALVRRASALGVALHVSTHYPDLWRCLSEGVHVLPPPPLAAYEYVEALPAEARLGTALLYADFLTTDVSPSPYAGPAGVGYAGRWSMGARECDLVDLRRGLRYRTRYPDGMPECRWLEACWMAGRVLPGTAEGWHHPEPAPRRPGRRRVLLQALTAKPGLLLPPLFYRGVFERVTKRAGACELLVLPNPSPQGQRLVTDLVDVLRMAVPNVTVEAPGEIALADVHRRLQRTDVLVGPDTFTSHLAAALRVPQVTISLPEHRPWRSIAAPCVAVVANRPRALLVEECADAVAAFLELPAHAAADAALAGAAAEWRCVMDALGAAVDRYAQEGTFEADVDLPGLVGKAAGLQRHLGRLTERLAGATARPADPVPPDLSRFREAADAARAVARWYHGTELTFTAAMARAC